MPKDVIIVHVTMFCHCMSKRWICVRALVVVLRACVLAVLVLSIQCSRKVAGCRMRWILGRIVLHVVRGWVGHVLSLFVRHPMHAHISRPGCCKLLLVTILDIVAFRFKMKALADGYS